MRMVVMTAAPGSETERKLQMLAPSSSFDSAQDDTRSKVQDDTGSKVQDDARSKVQDDTRSKARRDGVTVKT